MTDRRIIAAAMLCLCMPVGGCATVDLQTMTSASAAPSSEAKADINVVQKSVETLRAAFASRGLTERTSKRKMQAAADMLLNGLSASATQTTEAGYADGGNSRDVVLSDIVMATRHVEQTTRAAEVYLALASTQNDLSGELDSLQGALLASERASQLFAHSLSGPDAAELRLFQASIDELRSVTDEFGTMVRMRQSGKLALSAAS
ncbi:MAG: hypothetical protein WBF53_10100 [Litorimonas sp.]